MWVVVNIFLPAKLRLGAYWGAKPIFGDHLFKISSTYCQFLPPTSYHTCVSHVLFSWCWNHIGPPFFILPTPFKYVFALVLLLHWQSSLGQAFIPFKARVYYCKTLEICSRVVVCKDLGNNLRVEVVLIKWHPNILLSK